MTRIYKTATSGYSQVSVHRRKPVAEGGRRPGNRVSSLFLVGIVLGVCCCVNHAIAKPDFGSRLWKDSSESSFSSSFSESNEYDEDAHMEVFVNIIVAIAIFVFVAIFAFLLCLCCPICILAKMRSRRRGVVYRSATTPVNGTTVTTERTRGGGTVITVSRAQNQMTSPATQPLTGSSVASPQQLIAIPNNANNTGKPYPVQQSVTVVPLIQPMAMPQPQFPGVMPHGYHQQSPYAMQTTMPAPPNQQYPSSELPPPYPGLPRDMDSATNNLPYNPYYTEETSNPSAPNLKY